MLKFVSLLFILFISLWSSDEPIECQQNQQPELLSRYAGQYILKDFWDNLGKKRDWSAAKTKENDRISISIDKNGIVGVGENWHEGQHYECAFVKNNQIWLYDYSNNSYALLKIKNKQVWISNLSYEPEISFKNISLMGPLIPIGSFDTDESSIYFLKIFQNKCFKDEIGQKWCFGDNHITINQKKFKIFFRLETVEPPSYGTVLSLNEFSEDYWVFVPYKKGWKVFQDTSIFNDNHKVINPLIDKPWHILK